MDQGFVWAQNHKSGSHNLVVGANNAYSQSGGAVFGRFNVVNRGHATVTGGSNNRASGIAASVSGGLSNTASGNASSAIGGFANSATGPFSSVTGGRSNVAGPGFYTTVSGGLSGVAAGRDDWVAGSLFEDD